jgi:hypothetical protein
MTTNELREAEAAYRAASLRAEQLRHERNALIVAALNEGLTHRKIAQLTGLSHGRIGQLAQGNGGTHA